MRHPINQKEHNFVPATFIAAYLAGRKELIQSLSEVSRFLDKQVGTQQQNHDFLFPLKSVHVRFFGKRYDLDILCS